MNFKRIVDPLYNPAMGLIPLVFSMVIDYFYSYYTALMAGTISYAALLLLTYRWQKKVPYMLIVTGLVYILYVFFSKIPLIRSIYPDHSYTICELLLILIFSILDLFKKTLRKRIKKEEKNKRLFKITYFEEFFYVVKLYKNVLIIHLIIALTYKLLPVNTQKPELEEFIFFWLFLGSILLVIAYEFLRQFLLQKKINQEEWLPIVNETGGVVGKVAYSVSNLSDKKYMHPVIRIALIYKGMLYLKPRSEKFSLDPGKIDYPFEKFVFYSHTLNDAVANALQKYCGIRDLPVKFVFRYLYKEANVNRLIYLYTCQIHDQETFDNLNLTNGKLWGENQIRENLNKNILSSCFEKEYEILKNTVLMAEKIVQNANFAK